MTAEEASGTCGLPRPLGKEPEDQPEPENAEDMLAKLKAAGFDGYIKAD